MKELLSTIGLTVLFGIISIIFDLDNKVLDSLLKSVPIIIPTLALFKNNPKNYLKYIYFKKANINCMFKVKIMECNMSCDEFNNLIKGFIDNDGIIDNDNKVINKVVGNYEYIADLKISSSYMKLVYHLEERCLYIQYEGELSYKNFLSRVDNLYELLGKNLSFIRHKNGLYSLTIVYKGDENCNNPFINGLFNCFDNKNVNINYLAKYKTKIAISNNKIEFIGKSIMNLKKDVEIQLSPFKFK